MTRYLILMLAGILSITLRAGEVKSFSKQMNELKRSGDYVYAESSAPDEADAKSACDALLKIEVTKYLASAQTDQEADAKIVKDISDYDRKYIVQPKSDMFRVFGYIAKKEIADMKKGNSKKKGSKITEEHQTGSLPPADNPVDEIPEPTCVQSSESGTPATFSADGLGLAKWQLEMLRSISGEADSIGARRLLNRYKNQNRVKRLGDIGTPNPRPSDSFYIVFGQGGCEALLAPSSSGVHFDMVSGHTVSLSDYSGKPTLWFQISK